MEILDASQTASRLPYPDLADSIREVALAGSSDELRAPPRLLMPLPAESGGVLLVMPASDPEISITKLVTVHPQNPGRGLPTIQGEVVVMDATTGERLGLMDGSVVTARRTAALSMLAARELAPRQEGSLLVVGAGTQGRAHLEAFHEGLGVFKVFISSRSSKSAISLAGHARDLGVEAQTVEGPEEVLDDVSFVVTATTSSEPVLPEEIPEGIFVGAVGSFEPEAAELPPALISASQVIVDTMEGAKDEAGDLIQASQAGAFSWEDATALEDALRSSERLHQGTVVFKSVGHALWDLAAARTAYAPT
ncbi:MAG: delta(1)-pyrroline-2-carboxylate reductase family protein [Actinomycetota bacterium]|nr:delta(1)-pyrroline-2-carboxylate reductase family protein [Actinomycetota bacterium]